MDSDGDEHLKEVIQRLKQGLEVKDRQYRLKTYKQVFLGTDAVNFFLNEKYAANLPDAIALGTELMAAGVFQHCLREHQFKNERLFYRFVDQDTFHGGYTSCSLYMLSKRKRICCARLALLYSKAAVQFCNTEVHGQVCNRDPAQSVTNSAPSLSKGKFRPAHRPLPNT